MGLSYAQRLVALAQVFTQKFISIMALQIDVKRIENGTAVCNLYTGDRCVRIIMTEQSYHELIRDGFFIRDGATKDSADVINTTAEFQKINQISY
jgi:hypothetical protein